MSFKMNVVGVLNCVCFFKLNHRVNKADNVEHKQDEDKDRQRLGMLS